HGLTHQDRVEPAAPPRPPGDDTEFLAAFSECLADVVYLLGRKRPGADPGSVGFANPEHIIDRARHHSRSDGCLRRDRVRGCDKWISAVIDIEQCSLRAFE